MDVPRAPVVYSAALREPAARFVARSVVAWVFFFGLLRLSWTEAFVLLPAAQAQGRAAAQLFGTDGALIEVTLACSGAEALAACLAPICAYPAAWRTRVAGAAGGVVLIGLLNTLRIGTLGRVAGAPAWFDLWHVYLWPAALTLAVVGYVFAWMAMADRRVTSPAVTRAAAPPHAAWRPRRSARFVALTVGLLLLFTATSSLHLRNPDVLIAAAWIAQSAAALLHLVGVSGFARGNVLWTLNGGFVVTPECVVTPLIPIYLAAVLAYAPTWWRAAWGVAAALPIFAILSVVRLLVVALPASIGPLFAVHAFYQMLLAALLVFLAARWRHPATAASVHAAAGVASGALFVWLAGPLYSRLIAHAATQPLHDPQAALSILPSFQVGFYLALLVAGSVAGAWPKVLAGLAALGLTQAAGLLVVHVLNDAAGLAMPVSLIRGWALAAPVLVFLAVANRDATTR